MKQPPHLLICLTRFSLFIHTLFVALLIALLVYLFVALFGVLFGALFVAFKIVNLIDDDDAVTIKVNDLLVG